MATLRDGRKQEMRLRILDAARRRFESSGFAACTTQDIAEEAGVAHGSVFVHFGSRAALTEAVVEQALDQAGKALDAMEGSAGGLGPLLGAHLDALAGIEPIYGRLVVERALLPDAVQARIATFDAALARRLEAAARAGSGFALRQGVRPHFAFNAWMALVVYYLINRDLFAPRGLVLRQRRSELVDNYLKLVA